MSEIDPKLSRAYREASREAPPAALDTAILAAAREQVVRKPSRERSLWWNWMAPVGTIATLVLGVSIALLIESEQPVTKDEIVVREAPRPAASAPPGGVTDASKVKSPEGTLPGIAVKKEKAPAAAAQESPATQAFPSERRAKAGRMAAPKAAMESGVAADAEVRGLGSGAPAAADKLAPLRQAAPPRSPEAWLEEIMRLEREGRDKEAAEQLAAFRKAYPEYALPQKLRDR